MAALKGRIVYKGCLFCIPLIGKARRLGKYPLPHYNPKWWVRVNICIFKCLICKKVWREDAGLLREVKNVSTEKIGGAG